MIISHKKKFIILAPWKTASQTMRLRLNNYNESPYSPFFHFNTYLNRVVHQHLTCADFFCLPESRLSYIVSAFTRNPYDRVYSGFKQLQKDISTQPYATFPQQWIHELVMRQLSENFTQLCKSGFQFDAWLQLVRDDQIYESERNTNFPLYPAHYWTHIAGKQMVEFIGRVENFEQDFTTLLSKIGVDEITPGNANVSPVSNDSGDNPQRYRYVHLMSRASIEKINDLFADDFSLFGYAQIPT
jgi:hypothetical protein